MRFWNGNKSPARQRFELELLQAIAEFTNYPDQIIEDCTDYPSAEDEGNIFQTGVDVLVTVLGNPKFFEKEKIIIQQPLAKGLLGKRLLVIRNSGQAKFSAIQTESDMKRMVAGIPATWADAALFRANGYQVMEVGTLKDIFTRLAREEFDYVSLGALEIEEIFSNLGAQSDPLRIHEELMLQYPMPLVFYVNPDQPALAKRILQGLQAMLEEDLYEAIFDKHFGGIIQRLSLDKRKTFHLFNPLLPDHAGNSADGASKG